MLRNMGRLDMWVRWLLLAVLLSAAGWTMQRLSADWVLAVVIGFGLPIVYLFMTAVMREDPLYDVWGFSTRRRAT